MNNKNQEELEVMTEEFNADKRKDLPMIDPRKIKPNPNNKREIDVNDEEMQKLIASIEANGVITALMIKPNPNYGIDGDNQEYVVYGGNRRITAVKILLERGVDIKYIPCQFKKKVTLEEELLTQLTENSGVPYTPIEKAEVIANLINNCGWTPADIEKKTGEKQATVSNLLKIAGMSKKHKKMIIDNVISTTLALQVIRESETAEEFDGKMEELFQAAENLKAQGKTQSGKRALITSKNAKGVVEKKSATELLEELCLHCEKKEIKGENVDLLFNLTKLLRKPEKDTLKKLKELFV